MSFIRPLRAHRQLVRNFRPPRRCYSSDAELSRDYNSAVKCLNALQSNFAVVEAIRKAGPGSNELAIPQMVDWLRRIGYAPDDFDALNAIHVAGTKGKGSTSVFISSIIAQYFAQPYRNGTMYGQYYGVGLYTSPHLRSVRERIQVNNKPILERDFAEQFWSVSDKLEKTMATAAKIDPRTINGKPVYFHFLTLMALRYYMKREIQTAVIECGIGGEYDTTNIFVKPSVTAVTSLGLDHQTLLGETIDSIAWHKSGIFKKDVPAFTVAQPEAAMRVLQARARERGTSLHIVPEHPALRKISLGLQGDFQRVNASLAVAVCAAHLSQLGFKDVPEFLDPAKDLPALFVKGLESARLGGRCDRRHDTALVDMTWYIDGGHTFESVDVAARWFATTSERLRDNESARILIFNQQTRDASALMRHLHAILAATLDNGQPFTHAIFCTNKTYKKDGYKPDLISMNSNQDDVDSLKVQHGLAATYQELDSKASIHVLGSIEEAVEKAYVIAEAQPTDVFVTGSLHLVGGLIEILESDVEAELGVPIPYI